MNFGDAIDALKQGQDVAREGWNGKNMKLALKRGEISKHGTFDKKKTQGVDISLFDSSDIYLGDDPVIFMPTIMMTSATGAIVIGWLASQTDIMASDWVIVD